MLISGNAFLVVVILELILAVYAVSLGIVSKNKIVKIANFVFAVFWVIVAIYNVVVNGIAA